MYKKFSVGLVAAGILLSLAVQAAPTGPVYPVIPVFGGIMPMPSAAERPDPHLRYRVVLNVTKAASSPESLNPSLEKVARFINLLGADKIHPAKGDIIAIIHGPATPVILQSPSYAARTKVGINPNVALIAALQRAGVSIQVCSQAMIGNKITSDQVAPDITIDVSALTTLANLQLRGYVLIPD